MIQVNVKLISITQTDGGDCITRLANAAGDELIERLQALDNISRSGQVFVERVTDFDCCQNVSSFMSIYLFKKFAITLDVCNCKQFRRQ